MNASTIIKSEATAHSARPAAKPHGHVRRPASTHDLLRANRHPLDSILAPKSVAVIGATETAGSVGRTVFQNLGRGGFDGVVYPVNPKRSSVLCVKAYANINAVPEQ